MSQESLQDTGSGLSPVPSGRFLVPAHPAGAEVEFSLVVATRNESHNLAELVARLKPAIEAEVGISYEILVVDDDSPDLTWQVALEMAECDPHLVVLRRMGERGLATAVVRGWQAARGRYLGVIDGDLQHPPEVTGKLIHAMKEGAELAVASRDVEGGGTSDWSVVRQMISRASRALGRLILPRVLNRVTDPMTGFFIVRRTALEGIELAPRGYKILVEVLARSRAQKITEVGYVFNSRQRGESKASMSVFFDYLRHLAELRSWLRESARNAQPNTRSRGAAGGN